MCIRAEAPESCLNPPFPTCNPRAQARSFFHALGCFYTLLPGACANTPTLCTSLSTPSCTSWWMTNPGVLTSRTSFIHTHPALSTKNIHLYTHVAPTRPPALLCTHLHDHSPPDRPAVHNTPQSPASTPSSCPISAQ